jgi:hypothetical protein
MEILVLSSWLLEITAQMPEAEGEAPVVAVTLQAPLLLESPRNGITGVLEVRVLL